MSTSFAFTGEQLLDSSYGGLGLLWPFPGEDGPPPEGDGSFAFGEEADLGGSEQELAVPEWRCFIPASCSLFCVRCVRDVLRLVPVEPAPTH